MQNYIAHHMMGQMISWAWGQLICGSGQLSHGSTDPSMDQLTAVLVLVLVWRPYQVWTVHYNIFKS